MFTRQPAMLQFRYDAFGEIQPIVRQKRKHQIETIRRACRVPGLHFVGDLHWRSSHYGPRTRIRNATGNFADRQPVLGKGPEPFQIRALSELIESGIWIPLTVGL
jgi:hypothetical protein